MVRRTLTIVAFGLLLLLPGLPAQARSERVSGEVEHLDKSGQITVDGVTAQITAATVMYTHLREPLRLSELAVGVPVDMVVTQTADGTEAVLITATVAR